MRFRVERPLRAGLLAGLVLCVPLMSLMLLRPANATAPYTPSDLLGQTDAAGQPNYTSDAYNNLELPKSGGFQSPSDVKIDTLHHKLYVLEGAGANRVSVFNLDNNNQLIDRQPDVVLGQPQFNTTFQATTSTGMSTPLGIAVDEPGNRLFVADTFNNRVLVFDTSNLVMGQAATVVLGQANFTSAVQASGATGMRSPIGMAFDPTGNRLFVADIERILVFNAAALTTGMAASNVIGKPDFTTTSCSVSATCTAPYNMAYDDAGKRLFVGEGVGKRVLMFDVTTITNGMAASAVLGQPDFTSQTLAITQSGLQQPRNIAFDPLNNRIFVGDNNRIMVFNTASITNGQNAVAVLGQTDFTSSASGITQNHFTSYGLALNPATGELYVSDLPNSRVMIFDVNAIANGENAVNLMGQVDVDGTLRWTTNFGLNRTVNATGFDRPRGVVGDTTGHRLFVADQSNGRVLVFNQNTDGTLPDRTADYVLGQADFAAYSSATDASTLASPTGLAYDAARKLLFVSDYLNARVLVYDVTTISNGEPAAYVLGQPDFTSSTSGLSDTEMESPYGLTYDDNHQTLFVVDRSQLRVLAFNIQALSNGMAAAHVIGQTNFTSNSFISDSASLSRPEGLAYDNVRNRLYVTDIFDDRVLVFDGTAISDGMAASYVLGQSAFEDYDSITPSASGITAPQGVAIDPSTGRLFVAGWDCVVLAFDTTNIANGMPASAVLGQPDFNTSDCDVTQTNFDDPYGLYVDPITHRLYASDDYDNRVVVFDFIRINSSSLTGGTLGEPYTRGVSTAGGQGTTTLTISAGALPTGLTMNSAGIISGTPTSVGTFNFTVTATDDNGLVGGYSDAKQLSISIAAPPPPAATPTPTPAPAVAQSTPLPAKATPVPTPTPTPVPEAVAVLNNEPQFSGEQGSAKTLNAGDVVAFELPGEPIQTGAGTSEVTERHTATVNSVGDDFVDLTIASEPIKFRLMLGESRSVDVDRDGTNDLMVRLAGITGGKADLIFKRLVSTAEAASSPMPSPRPPVATPASESDSSSSSWLIVGGIIAGVVLVIVVTSILLARRRGPKFS